MHKSFSHLAMAWGVFFLSVLAVQATDAGDNRIVDYQTWTPAQAETIRTRAASQQLEVLQATASHQELLQLRNRQLEQRSGYGTVPHAPQQRDERAIKEQMRLLTEIQRQAARQAAGQGKQVADVMASLMPVSPAPGVNMVLKTPSLGGLTGGGWAYAFDPGSQAFLGYSSIGGGGSISLPVAAGATIDLIVFPAPPFAFQVARSITVLQGQELMLLDAVEVSVTVTDLDDTVLFGVNTSMNLVLKSYLGFGWGAGNVAGSGSIFLAPGETYELSATPEFPYLSGESIPVESSSPSLVFKVEKGVIFSIQLDDPNHLVGQGGCMSSGYMTVYSSQDVLGYNEHPLSDPQAQFDGNSNLTGFFAAVPANVAFDYQIYFDTDGNSCWLEDISARFVWYSGDQTIHRPLKSRPRPNFILQTPAGTPLAYDYGVVNTDNIFEQSGYFSPGSMPSLTAGKTYYATVQQAGVFSVNETKFVAQAGDFDVVLESEPLISVKGIVTVGGDPYVAALLEFYRAGVLVEAFEYSGGELTMEIPAGTYDIRVSGITGNFWDNFVSYSVFLQPVEVERTLTGIGEERVDFALDLPAAGVHFTLLNGEFPYQFFVFEGETLQSGSVAYPWTGGILSDYPAFDLVIRGPGFDDEKITVTPAGNLPNLDLASVQGPVGRLQGTVVDETLNPVEGVQVDLFAEDGVIGWNVTQTGPSGAFDIPKVKNGLFIFNAPDAGDSMMVFHPVTDPQSIGNVQIKLTNLAFHNVSEGGPIKQLLFGTGNRGYQIVFLSEGYVAQKESFTDSNPNGVWDGALFIDFNTNGVWDQNEPTQLYGDRVLDYDNELGTDLTAGNEPFGDLNGDGYPNIDDFSVFVQNTKNYIRSLLGTPDIQDNIDFDAYIVFLPSVQAGLDVFDQSDTKIIDLDTRFGGALLLDRYLLSVDYGLVIQTLEVYAPERDLTVVMMNQPVSAGRANSFILAYGGVGNSPPNSLVSGHEFGHNPGGLADEYNEFNGTSLSYFAPTLKHLTHRTVTADIPWFDYLGPRNDLPVSAPQTPGNGVFAGGSYNAGGVYRSTTNSRMRYTAPLFNDISLEVFKQSLCLQSLTANDFIGSAASDAAPEPGVIFSNGFEAISGVLALCQ